MMLRLMDAESSSEYLDRLAGWNEWYRSCCVRTLDNAVKSAQRVDICPYRIWRADAKWRRQTGSALAPNSFQKDLYVKLRKALCPDLENRIRHKLTRWKLTTPIGILTRRLQPRMATLVRVVPPRVIAAVIRTIWNGWCTAARFQRVSPCVLGCSHSAEDRIEHYAYCKFTKWVANRMFHLSSHELSLATFLLLEDSMSEERIGQIAAVVFAVYTVTNRLRGDDFPRSADAVRDALEEAAKSVGSMPSRTEAIPGAQRGRVF